jgi:rubrerythrin
VINEEIDYLEVQVRALINDLKDEETSHQKTAKQFVDMQAYVGCLEKKIASLFTTIEHDDEKHRAWLKEAIDKHFGLE